MDNETHLIMRYQNNSLRKNRRTHYDFVVVCVFTVLACSAFVILIHTKSNEDMVSKAAADIRKLEVQLQENFRSMVQEEVRKMIREELANCAVGNRNGPTQGKPVYSSSAELILTKEMNDNTDPTLKTLHVNVDGEIRTTDSEILSHKASSKSIESERDAVVQTSNIFESATNSVAGRSNHSLTRIEDNRENQMFNERHLRSDPTSSRSDAVQVADSRIMDNVPLRVKRNSGDSKMKVINIKDGDEGVIVKCSDHVRNEARLNSSELNGEGKKFSAPSKLIEETRCPEIEVVAAHFGADSSPFKTQKIFYRQNDLVSHPTGEYQQWKVEKWYHDLHMFKHVNFTNVGTFIVQKKGLYFVYGQVYFTEGTDSNGFTILKNNEVVYRCVTSSTGSKTVKELVSNTCFTGGLVICQKGDELKVRGLYPGRQVVFDPTDTFFGMFKLTEGSWSGG